MIEFSDILYGKVALPDWLQPFLRVPEFVRLRGVRLSNVDSFQFKDFSGPSRWEHCVAVAFLAIRCAEKRRISERELVHFSLAALLHDVATPPFAHTMEYVLQGFSHELESQRLLKAVPAGDTSPDFPVFASQLPRFRHACDKLSRQIGIAIDADEVARLVVGEGDLGFLLNGTLDLDNADNVTRASLHLGIEVDRHVPLGVADWLASQDGVPLNLREIREDAVIKWLSYRTKMYQAFFESSDEELGRQAFLQHLCRRALTEGVPRRQLIWNTDEGFLSLLESADWETDVQKRAALTHLVQRYRLLEPVFKIAEVPVEDEETLRILKSPRAARWIENELVGTAFEPFVLVNSRRYDAKEPQESLFPPAPGAVLVFKLGQATKTNQLPGWLKHDAPQNPSVQSLRRFLSDALRKKLSVWIAEKPWLSLSDARREDVIRNLDGIGDWSFRLSRNETLHPYPSTFVHAIPACLISALGLRGELVLDPFGGTGQTAVEAVKAGGRAVSADINNVALLVAKSKITYLSDRLRHRLKSVSRDEILDYAPCKAPAFDGIEKWHHPKTLKELCQIRNFIQSQNDATAGQFLLAVFSAILTMATGRKGKQHGFFADNTPLPKGQTSPPYEDALDLFMEKLRKNLAVIERLYSFIERSGLDPEVELKRVKVVKADVTRSKPQDYGITEHTLPAIITSPPYLCMSDYSLGQRLSYYWLFPDELNTDLLNEIGARRKRFQTTTVLDNYLADFEKFGGLAGRLLRPGGFLAMVLGAPVAKAFAKSDVLGRVDLVLKKSGLSLLWSKWRPIHWHRNHGYACLKEERIALYANQ